MVCKEDEGGVILCGEEFNACGVFERVDVILFGEFESVRFFQGVL